jgi:hypothetical protein
MAPVAIVFAVLVHGNAGDVGFVAAAQTIPLVILLLVGGVVGDWMSRRKLMLQSDSLRTVAECGADGRVMDGMHRVAQALLEEHPTVLAVQFGVQPEPDFRNVRPEDLPY